MSADDQLFKLIMSWLDQRDDFSCHLRELACELESVNEKCNVGCAVGNTTTLVGGVAMIGAGVATFFSGGAAAPLLAVAAACGTVGSSVTLTSKLIEQWLEKGTLKKAKKISEDNKELGEKIQTRITEQIGDIISNGSGLNVADDYVIECILRAIAKRHRIPWMEVIGVAIKLAPHVKKLTEIMGLIPVSSGQAGWFPNLETILRRQAAGFLSQATLDALKIAGKRAVQVGGGVFTVALTLPDTIDNYERAIKNNNVTGPSKELRKAADELKRSTQNFREALKDIEKEMKALQHRR